MYSFVDIIYIYIFEKKKWLVRLDVEIEIKVNCLHFKHMNYVGTCHSTNSHTA